MDKLLAELVSIQSAFQARTDFAKTLALLGALKAGEVTLDCVTLTAGGWTVAAPVAPPVQVFDPDEGNGLDATCRSQIDEHAS